MLKQALLRASGPVLLSVFLPPLENVADEDLPSEPRANPELDALIEDRLRSEGCNLHEEVHDHVDRLLLTRVIEQTGGSQHRAARRLGIARETLRRRIQKLGLRITPMVETCA